MNEWIYYSNIVSERTLLCDKWKQQAKWLNHMIKVFEGTLAIVLVNIPSIMLRPDKHNNSVLDPWFFQSSTREQNVGSIFLHFLWVNYFHWNKKRLAYGFPCLNQINKRFKTFIKTVKKREIEDNKFCKVEKMQIFFCLFTNKCENCQRSTLSVTKNLIPKCI